MGIADQIIQIESGGNPNAQNANSTAGGLSGFTDATWLNTLKKHRPDLVQQFSPSDLLAMKRSDPVLARSMTEAHVGDNTSFLRDRGFEPTPANIYLAHFAGPTGAASLLGAQPDASVASIMGPAAVKANPFLAKMTVADLQKWAGGKMGGGGDATSAPVSPGFSQFAAAPSGAPAASAIASAPSAPPEQATATADPLAAIPAMVAQFQQPQKFLPSMQLIPPESPGMARARALARAMATRPLGA